jgi:hypothetical protein
VLAIVAPSESFPPFRDVDGGLGAVERPSLAAPGGDARPLYQIGDISGRPKWWTMVDDEWPSRQDRRMNSEEDRTDVGGRVFEYRVTKYDPALRDSSGAYTRDEWTSVGDVGRSFGGAMLNREEYQRVEDAYVAAALAFLREAGVSSLAVAGLENHGRVPLLFRDGSVLGLEQIGEVVRRVLREDFWCRLEGTGAFVHLGYDYYMYVGTPHPCPAARVLASGQGLFVEEFHSPYGVRDERSVPDGRQDGPNRSGKPGVDRGV